MNDPSCARRSSWTGGWSTRDQVSTNQVSLGEYRMLWVPLPEVRRTKFEPSKLMRQ
jgi:hypothetical protein